MKVKASLHTIFEEKVKETRKKPKNVEINPSFTSLKSERITLTQHLSNRNILVNWFYPVPYPNKSEACVNVWFPLSSFSMWNIFIKRSEEHVARDVPKWSNLTSCWNGKSDDLDKMRMKTQRPKNSESHLTTRSECLESIRPNTWIWLCKYTIIYLYNYKAFLNHCVRAAQRNILDVPCWRLNERSDPNDEAEHAIAQEN